MINAERNFGSTVKAELYADWTDEGLIVTRDEAGQFCAEVRKRLGVPMLTRPYLLTALIGLRKIPIKAKRGGVTRQVAE